MRLLLDTHALLWWWTDDKQLSSTAREAIAEERNTVLVSAASVWEISTKFRLGKLAIAEPALKQFHQLIEADGFEHLPIAWQHSLLAGSSQMNTETPLTGCWRPKARLKKPGWCPVM